MSKATTMALFTTISCAVAIFPTKVYGAEAPKRGAVSVRTGYMGYQTSGLVVKKGSNTQNFSLELTYFSRPDLAAYAGYRRAVDTELKRSFYQAGYGGLRYYLFGAGAPQILDSDFGGGKLQ